MQLKYYAEDGKLYMKEIQRVSVTDSVIQSIKAMIVSGECAPGSKLPTENEMCQSMKVSRTCVREAIRVLQALRMVEILPGKGAFVSENPTPESEPWYAAPDTQFNDFIEVRIAIETISTRLAIEQATKRQINKLAKIHQSFLDAIKERNLAQTIMFDELFHTEIVNMTNNKLLININKQLVVANRKYRCESFTSNETYNNAVIPHTKIVECFYDHNPERGAAEMLSHLQITRADMAHLTEAKITKK